MSTLRRWTIIVVALVLVAGAGFFLSGCQRSNEKSAEKMMENAIAKATGGKADVDIKGGKVSIKTKEGTSEFSTSGGEWPGDLTVDVPKIEGKVKGVIRSSEQNRKHWTIAVEGVEEGAFDKYIDGLKEKGWTIAFNATSQEGGSAQATKDKDMVLVGYSKSQKTMTLSVTTGIIE